MTANGCVTSRKLPNASVATPRAERTFKTDELIQAWMRLHLQIIGEAAANVSAALQQQHPGVKWRLIIGFRNVLVHHYFKIDYDAVWDIIDKDVPELKAQVEGILKTLPPRT